MERSALGAKTKRNTCFQEGIRRLRAMDGMTTTEERNAVLSKYMDSLRASGYPHRYRLDVLKGVLERGRQMAAQGTSYRNRTEIEAAKEANKQAHVTTWFLRGQHTSTINVQATPRGELANRIRAAVKSHVAPDGG